MTSIGETLRRERLRRHLEIPKIASELRISTRFLEAIEQDDFAKLPGGVFTRSFVRQYASVLGLDVEGLLAELDSAAAPEPEVLQLSDRPKPDVPGIEMDLGNNWQSIGERPARLPSWVRAGGLLVALMVVCSGVYWWWQRPHHQVAAREIAPTAQVIPAPPAPQPAGNQRDAAVPAANPPVASPAAAQPAVDQAAKTEPPAVTPEIPVSAPNPNATVRLGITADEAVWIRAEVNGKVQFSGTLQPHESRNIDADGEVRLRLGNAGGVSITLNGKPVGAMGPKGQIRDVQFTSGGFQIVSPPKLLDPLDRL